MILNWCIGTLINRLVEEFFPCLLHNVRNGDSSHCTILSALKALVSIHTSDHNHIYDESNWTSPLLFELL